MSGNDVERDGGTLDTDIPPTIASLQQHFETVRQSEINRIRRRLGKLSQYQESAIDSMTRGIINKILDAPMAILKVASAESDSGALLEVVHRVFNLGDVPQGIQALPQV